MEREEAKSGAAFKAFFLFSSIKIANDETAPSRTGETCESSRQGDCQVQENSLAEIAGKTLERKRHEGEQRAERDLTTADKNLNGTRTRVDNRTRHDSKNWPKTSRQNTVV
ncbi:hypothetical protein TGPRC2_426580 [Toxoplasma gondii TgCatPRC2]|uniref:Uncharacterized protein n=1 Tax=Toxoplasma gondii TgCatPRC2 TaxID=1130821 RepID=A0A151H391_TOXGO|nr:hypothetical protein TGPRC2_426580 [Toxoplasma gondii TgCatPRC2]